MEMMQEDHPSDDDDDDDQGNDDGLSSGASPGKRDPQSVGLSGDRIDE